MHLRRLWSLPVALSFVVAMTTAAFAQSMPSSTTLSHTTSPQVLSCSAGWEFSIISQPENNMFVGMEKGTLVINPSSDPNPVTEVSTISSRVSKSSSVSATLGGGWGPINASVGYQADLTQTWTTSDSYTITIDPGYEGYWYYGVAQNEWYGNYYYLQSDCYHSNNDITAWSPRQKAVEAQVFRIP